MKEDNSSPSAQAEHDPTPKTGTRRPARTAILSLLGLLVAAAAGTLLYLSPLQAAEPQTAAAAPPPMPVEVTEVSVATAEEELSAVGTLQANESVRISAEIAGRIDRIGFAEGEQVRQDKTLIFLDASIPKAQLDRAEASRALSEANYRRAEALLGNKAVSQRERDEAYAQWQLDEANVRLAKAQWEKTRIDAPFAGTLGLRQVSPGDYIQPGQPLVNLEDTSRLKVEFRLPEKFSAQVKIGQPVRLESDAFPGRSFLGRVYAVDPQVEESSRSLVLRALLENRDGALRPGQFVNVNLGVATREGVLFIPEQALISQPKAQFVFKVVEGKAQMVPVQTGVRRKGWVEITSGLGAKDEVVTGGHQKIGPGSPVQALPADPALFAKID